MTVSARDQVLQRARAKAKRIDSALTAIDALDDDEAEFVYAKLENRVLGSKVRVQSKDAAPKMKPTTKTESTIGKSPAVTKTTARPHEKVKEPDDRRHCRFCGKVGHNVQTCEEKKAAEITGEMPKTTKAKTKPGPKPGSLAGKPNYAGLAREVLAANPQGLRAYEIGKKIGQNKVQNAFGTLKLLERLGYAERHGDRYNALWTVPGFTPVPRVETIAAAIVHILKAAAKPMDAWKLRDEVVKIIVQNTGKRPRLDSVTTEISSLMSKGIIDTDGLNEHGPLYVLEEGGVDATTLN